MKGVTSVHNLLKIPIFTVTASHVSQNDEGNARHKRQLKNKTQKTTFSYLHTYNTAAIDCSGL